MIVVLKPTSGECIGSVSLCAIFAAAAGTRVYMRNRHHGNFMLK